MNCRPRKRRETPIQQVIRLLHKTHKEVHEILAIVSNPADTDFTKEDATVRAMTKNIREAQRRIPSSREKTNQER
jgi:hypothetical protein